jgi:polyhydroxyalkanoate synthesis regulator phasin
MATDDRFRQYSEAGEEFVEAARSRAVEFLREVAKMGQTTQRQAADQVEDLVDVGRKGTDQVLDVIRKEIAAQLGSLGLATKSDLEALERRLAGTSAVKATPTAKRAPAAKRVPTGKRAPAEKRAPAKKGATARKAAAARATAPPAKKAAASTTKIAHTSAAASTPSKAAPAKAAGATKSS